MTKSRISFLLLVVCAGVSSAQQSRVDFAPVIERSFPNPGTYTKFLVAPLVASAMPDVVCLDAETPTIRIVDIDPAGSSAVVTISVAGIPTSAATEDLEGDGDFDLVVACNDPQGVLPPQISVLLNDGAGSFTRSDSATVAPIAPVHIADLDGDADFDVVVGRNLLIGTGNGSFLPAVAVSGGTQTDLRDVIPADFDGDGDRDLLIIFYGGTANGVGLGCRFLRRNASGTYSTMATQLLVPATEMYSTFASVAVGDMNSDGASDVVAYTRVGNVSWMRLQTFMTNANLELSTTGALELRNAGENISVGFAQVVDLKIAVADISGDGHLDVVFGMPEEFGFGGDSVTATMLENDGTGGLRPFLGTGIGGSGMTGLNAEFYVVDYDLDGDPDLVWKPRVWLVPNSIFIARNESGVLAPNLGILPITPRSRLCPTSPLSPTFEIEAGFFFESAPGSVSVLAGKPFRVSTYPNAALPPSSTALWISGPTGLHEAQWQVAQSFITSKYVIESPEGSVFESLFYRNFSLTSVAGDLQSQCAGLDFATPLVVRALDQFGAPIVGANFTVTSANSNIATVVGTNVAETDADGDAAMTLRAGPVAGTTTVSFTSVGSISFQLTSIAVESIVVQSGDSQATNIGMPFPLPISFTVVDCYGSPIVGETVTLSVLAGPPIHFSSNSVVTDSFGAATVTATADSSSAGLSLVGIQTDTTMKVIFLGVRGLFAVSAPLSLQLRYDHENASVPLVFAADTPLPLPGYVATPFGDVYTSILSPGPGLVVLDGLGIFGPPNPTMVTNSLRTWSLTVPLPSPLGITLVAQVYGYDPAYGGLDAYFISNHITLNL